VPIQPANVGGYQTWFLKKESRNPENSQRAFSWTIHYQFTYQCR